MNSPEFGLDSPMNQRAPTHFKTPPITGVQCLSKTTATDTPILGKGYYELSKLLPLTRNLTLHKYTLIGLNN